MITKNLLYPVIGFLLLIALFFFIKNSGESPSNNSTPTTASSSSSTSSAQVTSSKIFELVVKNRKLVSGPETISVKQGDSVTIKITVDEDEELHLHGYDKSVDLTANQPAILDFKADLTGHFPYELEKSKTEMGALEVSPE